jgi:hypothetical protein
VLIRGLWVIDGPVSDLNPQATQLRNRGPWNTFNDAVVGLLLYHQDLYARRSGSQ